MYIDPDASYSLTREIPAPEGDLAVLKEEKWLQDAEVQYLVYGRNGRWYVDMLFFDIHEKLKIRIRKINDYHSRQKAETFASIFQRGIRKDTRGTLKRKSNAYHICNN